MSTEECTHSIDKDPLPSYLSNDDILEEPEEDGISSLNKDDEQIYAPPPRIAARFYRPSNNRRRSSAASSRRNSLSSTHSHSSTRSFQRGGCQSNHVAQHLRRASILESRKARLAERAAHAEQVRLRAALQKATPRSTNNEERALAAQKARERHLAQVAASCAEEVRRAKRVAEEQKERKAAEEKRYRLEMEEKLAEAEKRRMLYSRATRRRRTSSSPSKKPVLASPTLSRDDAAKRIQAAWRIYLRKKAFEAFTQLELSLDQVHDVSFEGLTEFIAQDNAMSSTEKMLHLLGLLDLDSDCTSLARQTSTRTFLSAYLMLSHPAEVFQAKDGDQEQDLMNKAKDLVIGFEATISQTAATRNYVADATQLEALHMAYSAYKTAFSDWKAKDSSILIETLVASFVSLDKIWQSVKDDTRGEVAEDYREGIRHNQLLLLVRIKKLAGSDRGTNLVRKAIHESRKGRQPVRPAAQVRPRPVVDGPIDVNRTRAATASLEAVSNAAVVESPTVGQVERAIGKAFSLLPPNRVIVHELAINKQYRIEPSELKAALNRELCEKMREGFAHGQGDAWTVAMAENVRARLLKLLQAGNSMYNLISETFDPDFVAQQCKEGLFSYDRFFLFMANVLPKLCAPFRDEQVSALVKELDKSGSRDEQIDKIVKILDFVDLLSLDYQNYIMTNAAPTLLREASGYEEKQFTADLDAGHITLAKTKRWWHDANINICTEIDRRDPLHPPSTQKIYARGLVDLAITASPLRDEDIPETLSLDKARFAHIRSKALRIVTISAILLTAKSMLRRDVRQHWKSEANLLWDALKQPAAFADPDGALSARLFAIIESGRPMPDATKIQLQSTIARLLQQADRGRLTDPVIKVLFQRLRTHVFGRVSADSSGERVRVASAASEGLAGSGMAEAVGLVGEIVDVLLRIGEVDRASHFRFYERITKELEEMETDKAAVT